MKKSVYMTVFGISIVVAAVSLGVALTRYLGLLAYSPKGSALAAAIAAGDNVPATPPEQWNNLFAPGDGMKMASRLPTAGKDGSQAAHTSFVLVGTIVSSTPSTSRAVLWANGMKEPKAFREKEEIEPGAFLVSVERDKVWITRGKEREKLEILPVGSRARPTATAAPTAAPLVSPESPPQAFSPSMPSRPGTATSPRPTPDRTQAVAAPPPNAPPGEEDDEGTSPRRRGRGRGSRQ